MLSHVIPLRKNKYISHVQTIVYISDYIYISDFRGHKHKFACKNNLIHKLTKYMVFTCTGSLEQ
jgi:hypothetical protein